MATDCRQGNTKKVWVRKHTAITLVQVNERDAAVENAPIMDLEGFQRALRPIRVRNSPVIPTQKTYTFHLLETGVQNEAGGISETEVINGGGHERSAAGRGDSSHPHG